MWSAFCPPSGSGAPFPGNVTFALGLTLLLLGFNHGIMPYGRSSMGWGNPWVIADVAAGIVMLVVNSCSSSGCRASGFPCTATPSKTRPSGRLAALPAAARTHILGGEFFPNLIAPPFMVGLRTAFVMSAVISLVAAGASALRGERQIHDLSNPVQAAGGAVDPEPSTAD